MLNNLYEVPIEIQFLFSRENHFHLDEIFAQFIEDQYLNRVVVQCLLTVTETCKMWEEKSSIRVQSCIFLCTGTRSY